MAFAEVARMLRNSDTVTCLVTTQFPGRKDPVLMRVLFKEPGFLRVEGVPSGGPVRISITDQAPQHSMDLDPATKTTAAIFIVAFIMLLPGIGSTTGPRVSASKAVRVRANVSSDGPLDEEVRRRASTARAIGSSVGEGGGSAFMKAPSAGSSAPGPRSGHVP